jgi:hypothetical protein
MPSVMPLDASSKERLIAGWLIMQLAAADNEDAFWAFEDLDELCSSSPDDAWEIILGVLACAPSDRALGNLAAGPLEDLLSRHGPSIIERVEREARRSPAFANLLGGVWQNTMSDDIWARVNAVWDRRGWDGIPQA